MRFTKIIFAFLMLLNISGCSSYQEISFTGNWDTTRVLKNPYKGWYHHQLNCGINSYPIKNDSIFASFPGMDHLYLRLAWSYLEPEEGKFDWHYFDEVIEKYVPQGYNISFRITCSETGNYPGSVGEELDGVQYATPSWVRKAGAKGTFFDGGKGRYNTWVPQWGDSVFLEKLDQFHKAFAARYDGQSWVRYVDIGSIGDWGEGHTNATIKTPATVEEIKSNIDIYVKNYKNSQLVCSDDLFYYKKTPQEKTELYQYAVNKGISMRDDSPMVAGGNFKNHMDSWTIRSPEFYDPLYLTKPVVFELQHYSAVKADGNWIGKNGAGIIEEYGYSGAEIMRKAIETMHATYIGYHGFVEKWLSENPDLTKELANLCGYWYFPVKTSYSEVFKRGKNKLAITWLNKGIAPAYNDFDLILRFESEDGKNSSDVIVNSGNTTWLPDIPKQEQYTIDIPSNVKKGSYILKFRLTENKEKDSLPVQVGIKESMIDSQGFIEIGEIRIR